MRIFRVIPFIKLQNDTSTTVKWRKTMKNETESWITNLSFFGVWVWSRLIIIICFTDGLKGILFLPVLYNSACSLLQNTEHFIHLIAGKHGYALMHKVHIIDGTSTCFLPNALNILFITLLTPSLPWCHLKTTNKSAKYKTLNCFCLYFSHCHVKGFSLKHIHGK